MTFAQGLPLRAKEPFGLEHFLLRKEEKNEPYRTHGIFCRRIVLGYYHATLCSMVGSTYLSTSGLWTARGSGICAGEYLTPLDYLRYETSS